MNLKEFAKFAKTALGAPGAIFGYSAIAHAGLVYAGNAAEDALTSDDPVRALYDVIAVSQEDSSIEVSDKTLISAEPRPEAASAKSDEGRVGDAGRDGDAETGGGARSLPARRGRGVRKQKMHARAIYVTWKSTTSGGRERLLFVEIPLSPYAEVSGGERPSSFRDLQIVQQGMVYVAIEHVRGIFAAGADIFMERMIADAITTKGVTPPAAWGVEHGKVTQPSESGGLPSTTDTAEVVAWGNLRAFIRSTARVEPITVDEFAAAFAESDEMREFVQRIRTFAEATAQTTLHLVEEARIAKHGELSIITAPNGLDIQMVLRASPSENIDPAIVGALRRALMEYARLVGYYARLAFNWAVNNFSERRGLRTKTVGQELSFVAVRDHLTVSAARAFKPLEGGTDLRALKGAQPPSRSITAQPPSRPATAQPPSRPAIAHPPSRTASASLGIPRGEPTASIPVVDLGADAFSEPYATWSGGDDDIFSEPPRGGGSWPPSAIERDPRDPNVFYADVDFDDDFEGARSYVFKGRMSPLSASAPITLTHRGRVSDALPSAFLPPESIPVRDLPAEMTRTLTEDKQMLWFVVDGKSPQRETVFRVDAADIDDAIAGVDAETLGELAFVVKMLRRRLVDLFSKVESAQRVLFLFGFSESIESTQIYTDQSHLKLFPDSGADAIIQVYIPTDVDLSSKISFEDLTNTLVAAIAQLTGTTLPTLARDMAALDVETVINFILRNPDVLQDARVRAELARLGVNVGAPVRTFPRATTLMLRGGRGIERLPVQYAIVDAYELVPSNDFRSFGAHERYPAGLQERDYFNDPTERLKVELNAKNFDPAFAVNTNPDAMNGPPVVTQNGLVLGGNSRTMSMQLVYADFPNRADELRRYLKDLAPVFGLTEADVDAVQHPVLVRRLSADIQGFDDLRALVRQMNEGHSQKMTADVMGRALAAQLSDRSIAILGEGLTAQTDDDTQPSLRDFLGEYSDRFQHFVSSLRTDGVITDTNVNTWIDQNHNVFTPTAVALLETVLLGKLFSDTQKLARLPPALRRSLVSALPSFLAVDDPQTRLRSLALAVEAYGMASSYFRPRDKAAQAVAAVQREWVDTLNTNTNEYDKQLIRELTDDPIANRLLVALIVFNGPRKLATAFRDIAAMTRGAGEQDVEDMFSQGASELTLEQQLDSYLSGTVTPTYFVAPRDNSRMRQPRTDRGGLGELFRRKLDGVHLGRLYRALSNPR